MTYNAVSLRLLAFSVPTLKSDYHLRQHRRQNRHTHTTECPTPRRRDGRRCGTRHSLRKPVSARTGAAPRLLRRNFSIWRCMMFPPPHWLRRSGRCIVTFHPVWCAPIKVATRPGCFCSEMHAQHAQILLQNCSGVHHRSSLFFSPGGSCGTPGAGFCRFCSM